MEHHQHLQQRAVSLAVFIITAVSVRGAPRGVVPAGWLVGWLVEVTNPVLVLGSFLGRNVVPFFLKEAFQWFRAACTCGTGRGAMPTADPASADAVLLRGKAPLGTGGRTRVMSRTGSMASAEGPRTIPSTPSCLPLPLACPPTGPWSEPPPVKSRWQVMAMKTTQKGKLPIRKTLL